MKSILLTDEEIEASQVTFFQKAIIEVKAFIKTSQCRRVSIEKNRILYYSGRILPTEKDESASETTEVVKDLHSSKFCVPLVYKHSHTV